MASWKRHAPVALLVVLSFLVRFPALLNAAATNSDAAVVGLQAMHLAKGEWEPFLWGSGYQTSSDGVVAAAFFAVLGPTPSALMLSALGLHVLATVMVFFGLRARTRSPWTAAIAAMLLVFTTACVHSYALYPPRELSLALACSSFFTLSHFGTTKGRFVGGLLATLAVYADPYVLLFLPALGVFAVATTPRRRLRDLAAVAVGAALGIVPFLALGASARAKHGVESFRFDLVGRNAELFARDCMPWALGTKIFRPVHMMDYAPLAEGALAHGAQLLAVALLFALVGASGLVVHRSPRLFAPWLFGATLFVATLASFHVSPMVMDHFSMRYLAAAIFALPMLVAPALEAIASRRGIAAAAIALAPYLATAGAAGWIAHGPYVDGAMPVRCAAGRADDERRLEHELASHGVSAAVADYWSAYRLTFLFRESVLVVPLHPGQDRYAPYRATLDDAETSAYVHDELRSFEDVNQAETDLSSTYELVGEPIVIGPFRVRYLKRRAVR